MVPDMNARRLLFSQTICEEYKLGISTLKKDPCVSFEQDLSYYKKACDEIRSGNAKYSSNACEVLDIYETKYKNMPTPPYQRQPTNKLGVQ